MYYNTTTFAVHTTLEFYYLGYYFYQGKYIRRYYIKYRVTGHIRETVIFFKELPLNNTLFALLKNFRSQNVKLSFVIVTKFHLSKST